MLVSRRIECFASDVPELEVSGHATRDDALSRLITAAVTSRLTG